MIVIILGILSLYNWNQFAIMDGSFCRHPKSLVILEWSRVSTPIQHAELTTTMRLSFDTNGVYANYLKLCSSSTLQH